MKQDKKKDVAHTAGAPEKSSQQEAKPREVGIKPPFFTGWERPLGPPEKETPRDKSRPAKENTHALETPKGEIQVRNYTPVEELEKLRVDDGIKMFSRHHPDRQKKALMNVAASESGDVIAAIKGGVLVAYIGIHHPSEKERWGKPGYDWLYEFGAIEVSSNFREIGLADDLLSTALDNPFYEDTIMLTTGFTWHWDLEGTGMTKMEYHDLGVRLFGKYGFMEMATDEPNIQMDPANLFMVRIGHDASFSRYQKFAMLLFANEWESMLRGF